MLIWVYDEIGCAGAILDEFCLRSLAGKTVGWVFGLSVFSLKGEHIGWFEDGIVYDIGNRALGFVPGAEALALALPALAPVPAMPVFSKRPHVPGLRARAARPRANGWSAHGLDAYLAHGAARTAYIPRMAGPGACEQSACLNDGAMLR